MKKIRDIMLRISKKDVYSNFVLLSCLLQSLKRIDYIMSRNVFFIIIFSSLFIENFNFKNIHINKPILSFNNLFFKYNYKCIAYIP